MRMLAILILAGTVQAQTNAPAAGNATKGRRFFEDYGCYQCHGHEGQGGAGARLAPRPIAYAAFSKYVRHPSQQMPPYTAKVLPEPELADIYAFLRSIPRPPPASSIPLLQR